MSRWRQGNSIVRELFQELLRELERGETVAMATIVRRKGSVPREVGAKMLVHRGGRISGTVGGGCGEAEVWRSALNVIDTQRPNTIQVDLTEEIAMESQGVCGGIFDVFIQPWHSATLPGQPAMQEVALAIQQALEGEQAIVLLTVVAAAGSWRTHIGQHWRVHDVVAAIGNMPLAGMTQAVLTPQLDQRPQRAISAGKPHIE